MKKNKVCVRASILAVLRTNWKILAPSQSISNWISSALKKPPLSTTASGFSHGEVSRGGGDFTSKRTTGRQEKRSAAQNTDTGAHVFSVNWTWIALVLIHNSVATGFSVEDSDMPWCQKHSPVSVVGWMECSLSFILPFTIHLHTVSYSRDFRRRRISHFGTKREISNLYRFFHQYKCPGLHNLLCGWLINREIHIQ